MKRAGFLLLAIGLACAGCLGNDPDYSRRVLNEPLKDYFYKDRRNPVQDDPVFTETWDIDGS